MNQFNSKQQEEENNYQITTRNKRLRQTQEKDKNKNNSGSKSILMESHTSSLTQIDIGMNNNLEGNIMQSSTISSQQQILFEYTNPLASTQIGYIDKQIQLLTKNRQNNQQTQQEGNANQIINNVNSLLEQIQIEQSEDLKLQKARQTLHQIKLLDNDQINNNITIEFINKILKFINDGITELEQALLEVINFMAYLGIDFQNRCGINKFFRIFNDSGLIKLIIQIYSIQFLTEELDNKQDNNEQQYSNFTIMQAQTIAYIFKNKKVSDEFLKSIGKIITTHIQQLINKMNNQSNEDIQLNEEVQKDIKEVIKLLNIIQLISEDRNNRKYLIKQLKIHEIISSIILNIYQNQINNSFHIKLLDFSDIQDLQGSAFQTLGKLIQSKTEVQQYIQKNYEIIEHITQIIISFAQKFTNLNQQIEQKFNNSYNQSQTIQQYLPSQSIAHGALYFLQQLLDGNQSVSNQVSLIPGIIESLISLQKYGRKIHECQQSDLQLVNIRNCSFDCISYIQNFGSHELKKRVYQQYRFGSQCIEGIGIGGGGEESNDIQVLSVFIQLGTIYKDMNKQQLQLLLQQQHQQQQYEEYQYYEYDEYEEEDQEQIQQKLQQSQQKLQEFKQQCELILEFRCQIDEQIEDEGGMEEIDSFTVINETKNSVYWDALVLEQEIYNVKIYLTDEQKQSFLFLQDILKDNLYDDDEEEEDETNNNIQIIIQKIENF